MQKLKNLCQAKESFIKFSEDCKYCIDESILYNDDEKVIITKKEILFLELFSKNIKRVVSYHELEEYVWEGAVTNLDNIRALVKRLRKRLPEDSIKIVSGIGYTLGENVEYDS